MAEEKKRVPRECKNRTNNNFRCARDANGTPRTPDVNGADCESCPSYEYAPSRDAEKARAADSDAKKGSAIGTVVLLVAAVLAAAAIFTIATIVKSCVG